MEAYCLDQNHNSPQSSPICPEPFVMEFSNGLTRRSANFSPTKPCRMYAQLLSASPHAAIFSTIARFFRDDRASAPRLRATLRAAAAAAAAAGARGSGTSNGLAMLLDIGDPGLAAAALGAMNAASAPRVSGFVAGPCVVRALRLAEKEAGRSEAAVVALRWLAARVSRQDLDLLAACRPGDLFGRMWNGVGSLSASGTEAAIFGLFERTAVALAQLLKHLVELLTSMSPQVSNDALVEAVCSALFHGLGFALQDATYENSNRRLSTRTGVSGSLPSILSIALRTASGSGLLCSALQTDERQSLLWAAAEAAALPCTARRALLRTIRRSLARLLPAPSSLAHVASRLLDLAASSAPERVVLEPQPSKPFRPHAAVQVEAEVFLSALLSSGRPHSGAVSSVLAEALTGTARARKLIAFRVVAGPIGAGFRRFAVAYGESSVPRAAASGITSLWADAAADTTASSGDDSLMVAFCESAAAALEPAALAASGKCVPSLADTVLAARAARALWDAFPRWRGLKHAADAVARPVSTLAVSISIPPLPFAASSQASGPRARFGASCGAETAAEGRVATLCRESLVRLEPAVVPGGRLYAEIRILEQAQIREIRFLAV